MLTFCTQLTGRTVSVKLASRTILCASGHVSSFATQAQDRASFGLTKPRTQEEAVRRSNGKGRDAGTSGPSRQQRPPLGTENYVVPRTRTPFNSSKNANGNFARESDKTFKPAGDHASGRTFTRLSTGKEPDRTNQTVRVQNLPLDTNINHLVLLYSQFGPILKTRGIFGPHTPTPNSALITFANKEDAQKAMKARCKYREHKLRCTPAEAEREQGPDRTKARTGASGPHGPSLTVYNVPSDISVDEITAAFNKIAQVVDMKIVIDEESGERAHSLTIDFRSPKDAQKVYWHHRKTPLDLGDGPLTLRFVEIPSAPAHDAGDARNPNFRDLRRSRFIRVSRLTRHTTRAEVAAAFSHVPDLKDIIMEYFPDGQPAPSCLLEFETHDQAESAMDAHAQHPFCIGDHCLPHLAYTRDPAQLENPPHHTLLVCGFQGGLRALKAYVEPYARYVVKLSLLPTCHLLNGLTSRPQFERWCTGFVEFDTVEHATLAKEQLSRSEVEYAVRLRVTYAHASKPLTEPGGLWANDHAGERYGYGTAGGKARRGRLEAMQEERGKEKGRFDYEKVDWAERFAANKNW